MMSELFVAPVSVEVLDAALNVGVAGLICSEAQVPPDGSPGYGGIDYALLRAYHGGRDDVIVQRDHLKIMTNDKYNEIIKADAANGFKAVMLHCWEPSLTPVVDAVKTARKHSMRIELGPGEDDSQVWGINLKGDTADFWYGSWPVGLYVDSLGNKGQFIKSGAPSKTHFRAHNADYLSLNQLRYIAKHAAGVNLAPQLGTIQSDLYLSLSAIYGLPIKRWVDACMSDDDHAKRWCPNDTHMRVRACGHYHYDKIAWRGGFYDQAVLHIATFIRKVQDAIA